MIARQWLEESTVSILGCDPAKVTDSAELERDLGADSLDFLEIFMTAEDHFKIEIADDELTSVKSFGQAVALIESKVAPE
ncbi:acyl carrier protein [Sphingomonas sp. H160509]|uniref:acyl carrier protein n=1 Tax=Sphingomonas sp. H160509 TaxID=2955313 RepID=UPI0020981BED|nr:acyl carrier protein [Sphingomonas sp. H160509]